MKMLSIDSSAIAEIGWENDVLDIRFHSTVKPYFFPNDPKKLFEEFVAAESQGKFFHEYIKDKYQPLP